MTLVAATALAGVLPLMAEDHHQGAGAEVQLPLPPAVSFAKVPVSRLHLGMTAAEVTAIMGNAANATSWADAGGIPYSWLTFQEAPIAAKVTLKAGKVSSIALDAFKTGADDLPEYSRRAWPGMRIAAVRFALGAPNEVRQHRLSGIKLEQLIFRHAGDPDVSVFIVADRVIAKTIGREIPSGIFRLVLPLPPDQKSGRVFRFAQLGMPATCVSPLYGREKLHVDYTLNGRSAAHVIYAARGGHELTSVTFVEGVLTEIEDLGALPESVFQAG
jgi:hypothetical protein